LRLFSFLKELFSFKLGKRQEYWQATMSDKNPQSAPFCKTGIEDTAAMRTGNSFLSGIRRSFDNVRRSFDDPRGMPTPVYVMETPFHSPVTGNKGNSVSSDETKAESENAANK